jgi:hypothetical protein
MFEGDDIEGFWQVMMFGAEDLSNPGFGSWTFDCEHARWHRVDEMPEKVYTPQDMFEGDQARVQLFGAHDNNDEEVYVAYVIDPDGKMFMNTGIYSKHLDIAAQCSWGVYKSLSKKQRKEDGRYTYSKPSAR